MTIRLKRTAAALGLAAALTWPAALAEEPVLMQPPPPEGEVLTPALWTIEKPGGGTVALFGSVHLLQSGQNWRTEAFEAAFAKADVVVFETPIADMATPELQAYVAQSMMNPPGVTLSTLLDAGEKATVEKAATEIGAPFSALEPLRPWMAGLQLAIGFAMKQGFGPEAGVDKVIEAEARAAGKAADYFETAREQLDIFTTMTSDEEIAFLVVGAETMLEDPDQLKDLVAAWGRGDVAAIDAIMNAGLEETPELGKRLLEDRNARWVTKIESAYLADGKSYLIVVGAGHLAGPKSVQAMLRAKGIEVSGP